MPLSLGVTAGDRIQVGDAFVSIDQILRGRSIRVSVAGRVFLLTDQRSEEVLPDVFMSYGSKTQDLRLSRDARVAIRAPRELKITRHHAAV